MEHFKGSFLFDTYKRYKANTRHGIDWMIGCAKQIGLPTDYVRKDDSKYKIAIDDMTQLAANIAQSAQNGVPIEGADKAREFLQDAVRLRKETTEWYRVNNRNDDAHPHFTAALEQVGRLLETVSDRKSPRCGRPKPMKDDHSAPDSLYNVYIVLTNRQPDDETPETEEPHSKPTSAPRRRRNGPKKGKASVIKDAAKVKLTAAEVAAERDFALQCFLYDLNSIREFLKQLWIDCKNQKITLSSAAIVTDVALGVITRNARAFAEELGELDPRLSDEKVILDAIKVLYASQNEPLQVEGAQIDCSNTEIAYSKVGRIMCLEAIAHLDEYETAKKGDNAVGHAGNLVHSFQKLRTSGLRSPIEDNFTSAMRAPGASLPCWSFPGLQLVLDIQRCLGAGLSELVSRYKDDATDMLYSISDHLQYEDQNPLSDYMLASQPRFEPYFKAIAQELGDWTAQPISQMKENKPDIQHPKQEMFFMTSHLVACGLMSHRNYSDLQVRGISKTGWFLTAMAHLYNAARQVGGLQEEWPDLEFVVNHHDSKRIFLGARPTDPSEFGRRFDLAWGSSLQRYASHSRGLVRRTKASMDGKGLMHRSPTMEAVINYYKAPRKENWIALQNILAHLTKVGNESAVASPSDDRVLQESSNSMNRELSEHSATTKLQKKGKKARKNKTTVSVNTNSVLDKPHQIQAPQYSLISQLTTLKHLLTAEDLHQKFDYLSLYRRAHTLVERLRREVLYSGPSSDLTILEANPDPSKNLTLLYDLFHELRQNPRELGKITKIADIMREVIAKEGSAGIDEATSRLGIWEDSVEYQPGESAVRAVRKCVSKVFRAFLMRSTRVPRRSRRELLNVQRRLAREGIPMRLIMPDVYVATRLSLRRVLFRYPEVIWRILWRVVYDAGVDALDESALAALSEEVLEKAKLLTVEGSDVTDEDAWETVSDSGSDSEGEWEDAVEEL